MGIDCDKVAVALNDSGINGLGARNTLHALVMSPLSWSIRGDSGMLNASRVTMKSPPADSSTRMRHLPTPNAHEEQMASARPIGYPAVSATYRGPRLCVGRNSVNQAENPYCVTANETPRKKRRTSTKGQLCSAEMAIVISVAENAPIRMTGRRP